MQSTIRLLALVLIIQVAASLLSFSTKDSLGAFTPEEPLLNLSLEELSEIVVTVREEGEEERKLTLLKQDGSWVMPEYFSFPVAERKLDSFRDQLFTFKRPFPVGSSASAAKQFEVSEESFKTRVDFKKGENVLKTLYLGTSPSFKKVHARVGGEDLSYSIDFSGYELQGKDRTWADKEFIKIDRDKIAKIAFADFTLEQSEDNKTITLSDLNAETEEVNSKEANDLLSDATKPSFIEILGTEDKPEYNLSAPALTYTVTLRDGSEQLFSYGKGGEESHYILKISDKQFFFKVSSFQFDKVKDATRSSLVKEKKAEKEATESESDEPQPENPESPEVSQ